MLQNDYLVAKIGVDTAENEPYVKSLAVVARLTSLADRLFGHRHDTSLFPRLVLGCIDADLCK